MKLLEETIRELKGEDLEDDVRATVNLRIDFRIEESYVPDMNQRLMIYRRIAAARSEDELDPHHGGDARSLRPAAGAGAQPRRLRPHSRAGRRSSGSRASSAKARSSPSASARRRRSIPLRADQRWSASASDLQLIPPVSLKLDLKKRPSRRSAATPGASPSRPPSRPKRGPKAGAVQWSAGPRPSRPGGRPGRRPAR